MAATLLSLLSSPLSSPLSPPLLSLSSLRLSSSSISQDTADNIQLQLQHTTYTLRDKTPPPNLLVPYYCPHCLRVLHAQQQTAHPDLLSGPDPLTSLFLFLALPPSLRPINSPRPRCVPALLFTASHPPPSCLRPLPVGLESHDA